jgi:site-specific recombinase XerD
MYQEITHFIRWLRCKHPHTSTHRHYASDLQQFFTWVNQAPNEITVNDVDDYIAHAQAEGHVVATINRRLAALSAFYQFLYTHTDEPSPNPVIPRRHRLKPDRRLLGAIPDDTLDRLFAVIASPRDKAIFTLMLRCGLRVGEVHRLSLADLDLHLPGNGLPRLRIRGKGGKERTVYLSAQALVALKSWLAARPDSSDPALFLNRYKKRLGSGGIQRQLAVYCRQIGVHLTCHQLRHTFGRHLTEAQTPITTTQHLLGHSQLKTTQGYTHLANRQAQTEYDAAMTTVTAWLGGGQ